MHHHKRGQADIFQQIMIGILEPIRYLHSKGVCHGDLHPGNILIQLSGNDYEESNTENNDNKKLPSDCRIDASCIRLCDFGFAELSDSYNHKQRTELSETEAAVYRTQKGGAPGFAAPKVICRYTEEMEVTITDMWSIGCILLDMIHGLSKEWERVFCDGIFDSSNSNSGLKIMPLSQKSTLQWGQKMCNI